MAKSGTYTGFTKLGVNRYAHALDVLKDVTTGIFTKKNGYDVTKFDSWSDAMKKKIRRYWRTYDHLTARPHEPVRIRDSQKLKAVQRAARHQHYIGKFNTAFVPTDGVHTPIIKYNKKTKDVVIRVGQVESRLILLDPVKLALDPIAAAQEVVDKTPDAKSYRIQCGEHEFHRATYSDGKLLGRKIQQFQQQYANHEEWLKGVVAYYYDTKKQRDDFFKVVEKKREELRLKRKAAKERARVLTQKQKLEKLFKR